MTTIDRDRLRTLAETSADDGYTGRDNYGRLTVSPAVPRPLLDELDQAEQRATRAEAQSETRRQQTVYWKERAELFEAKMNELDRAYISEHGQRRRAEDEQDRLKNKLARRSETVSRLLEERNNAEARIKAVRDMHRDGGTGDCTHCDGLDGMGEPFPCPTISVLDGGA